MSYVSSNLTACRRRGVAVEPSRRRRCGAIAGVLLLGLLGAQPGVEVGRRLHFDDDRHEAVIAAAQLGALAAVDADLVGVDLEPRFVDEARDRVLLHAERRHPPGVDDVLRGEQEAHLGAGRHDQRVVDVEQVVRRRCSDRCPSRAGARRRCRASSVEKKLTLVIEVLVLPLHW